MKRLIFVLIGFSFVLLMVCAGKQKPPIIFMPQRQSGIDSMSTYFSNGIPIGKFINEKEDLTFSLEKVKVGSTNYMRLWLLYNNRSDKEYLLIPTEIVKLDFIRPYSLVLFGPITNILPETPTSMLNKISAEEAQKKIAMSIGGALSALSHKSETGAEVSLMRTENYLAQTSNTYESYKNSVSNGILRKNTVFPGQSINGYLFFKIPEVRNDPDNWNATPVVLSDKEINQMKIHLKFTTQTVKEIDLKPGEGE